MDLQSIIEGAGSKGEKIMVGLVNKTMANHRITGSIVKAMEASLALRAAVDKNLQFAYKSMNLTSRSDFDNLTAKVSELSRKQGDFETNMAKLGKTIDKNQ